MTLTGVVRDPRVREQPFLRCDGGAPETMPVTLETTTTFSLAELEIMESPNLMAQIRAGMADIRANNEENFVNWEDIRHKYDDL